MDFSSSSSSLRTVWSGFRTLLSSRIAVSFMPLGRGEASLLETMTLAVVSLIATLLFCFIFLYLGMIYCIFIPIGSS